VHADETFGDELGAVSSTEPHPQAHRLAVGGRHDFAVHRSERGERCRLAELARIGIEMSPGMRRAASASM
jgi:hypothetical protein